MNKLKIFVDRDRIWGDTFAVRIGAHINESTGFAIAEPMKFRVPSESESAYETAPAFTLTKDDAQAFMDELWSCGLRPTEGTGSAGALAAVQRHLEDMRKLVFTEKEIK